MLSHPRVRHHRMRQHSPDVQILGIDLSPVGEKVIPQRGMHVSHAKHSYVWLPRKSDYQTDRCTHAQTDARQSDPYVPAQTDAGQSDPYVLLCFEGNTTRNALSPVKQSYVWLPRKCDYRTDRRMHTHTHRQDTRQSDPYVPLCFAGDTKMYWFFVTTGIYNVP